MSNPDPQTVTLRNTLGEQVPTVTDDQGFARAVAPNGRLVVAAGQIIASAWGNTTYDQTMMTFANAGDRTNQWPVVQEGSLSFLMDSRTPWIYRQGAWRALPLGYLGAATGPAAQTDVTAWTTVVNLYVAVTIGRRYRINASALGQQLTSVGGIVAAAMVPANGLALDNGTQNRFAQRNNLAVNDVLCGSGAMSATGTATTNTATVALQATTTAGALRFAANSCQLFVEDIGG